MQASSTISYPSNKSGQDSKGWSDSDTPEAWQSYSKRVSSGAGQIQNEKWESRLMVQGMHCSACAGMVESALLAVPGVVAAQVNAMSSRALVTWDARLTQPSRWMSALSQAGYSMLPIQGVDAFEQSRKESRSMLWRWLVAGFCMMQVMMYAWPNYSALPGEMDALSDSILRWASWLLTLPVLLFSSQPFFAAAWRALAQKRISMDVPVALGIALTFAISSVAVWQPLGPWGSELYLDSLTMLVFFLLTGRWIEARLKQQVTGDLEAATAQLPLVVQRLDAQDQPHAAPLHSIRPGDMLLVRLGESFAVDGQLVQGSTAADESLLTGESQPVNKSVGDSVVAGSVNLLATVRMRATRVGEDTRFAQIAQLMSRSENDKPVVVQLADRMAGPFLWCVLALAMGALLYWWPLDPHRAVLSAITVLIVTCPCALALAAPAAFLSSASALARAGLLTRKLSAIERMAQVTSMVFDKTGTLTLGRLQVSDAHFSPRSNESQVWSLVAQMTADSLHPVSQSLHAHALQKCTSEKRQMAIKVQEVVGAGLVAQGDQGQVWRLGHAEFCGLQLSSNEKQVYLCDNKGWLASFDLQEALRPYAQQAISLLRQSLAAQGGSLTIASGDQLTQVRKIARQLGAPDAYVQAGCQAQDKLVILQRMRASGQVVAMVGDGINDAPVLAAADVSIAPAHGATLAMIKSDFVLTAESLQPLALLQPLAIRTMRIVRQNLWWALAYNMVSVPLAWMGWLEPWMAGLGMAVSSLLVLLNALRLRSIHH
ncbi:cation-translocating P-type ATPase [Variovorax sp. PCZ-1]|uniref:heavy metal translocating P-type ATPase n=1 Tax=Variovorax sp. PCZ-1 TaxID=2835533 RepID=UPI001BCD781F|nr:cation-translocating P-type ATPase [Variovorax sp. PCZ-1]MBS7807720.1 cadmium-translocating P-type ATPase [Variovorax sp. PCZ-1]